MEQGRGRRHHRRAPQISVGKLRADRIVDVRAGPDLLHVRDGNDLPKTDLRDNR